MIRVLLAVVLLLHALIHAAGFAKAFGLASLDSLKVPISRPTGIVWLGAALLLVLAAGLFVSASRPFWIVGAVALVASQIAIFASWSDARYGTVANLLLLALVIQASYAKGPFGLRAEYERLVREGRERAAQAPRSEIVSDADLARLPALVKKYLATTGAIGAPRPLGFRARMNGRIRASATAPWMPLTAEQVSFFDPPRRYFWLQATRAGIPVDGLHVYGESDASMRIRLLSLFPVVDRHGADMMRTETVTILNDMSIFAPASLLDRAIVWREVDAHSVEAIYSNGPHTIRAVLSFDDDSGTLANFSSDDRPALAEDGKTMRSERWSTPLRDYRAMGRYRLAGRGEARYAAPEGEYSYLELEILEVDTER